MGYSSHKGSPKDITTGDQIGNGEIKLNHLDPALYQEIRAVQLHNHSGAKSRRVRLEYTEGAFGVNGFYIYNVSGVRYHATVSAGGAWVLTQE